MSLSTWLKKKQLWLYSYLLTVILVIVASLGLRRRMSHNNGITAVGRLRVIDHPSFPPHDFFEPGREFSCRLRHASVSYDDDTIIQVRGASLKFADSRLASPLDLEMNTGRIAIFWTARNFIELAADSKPTNGVAFFHFFQNQPRGLAAAWDSLRKYPSSFSRLYYHSQTPQFFIGKDGVRRYVKFRLIPFDRGPESGLVDPAEYGGHLWKEVAAPGETRSVNYLKEEFAERLRQGPVKYLLQLQLHTPGLADTDEIINSNVEWDPATHPFFDVAEVEIDRILSWQESNWMRFSVNNHPSSLALIPASSIDDYNSILYMRSKIGLAAAARLLAYRLFGMPKLPPDQRAPTPARAQAESSQIASQSIQSSN